MNELFKFIEQHPRVVVKIEYNINYQCYAFEFIYKISYHTRYLIALESIIKYGDVAINQVIKAFEKELERIINNER